MQFAQRKEKKLKKVSEETRNAAVNMLQDISDAEFQYVLYIMKELKSIGKEAHDAIMAERRAFYEGNSTAESKDNSELLEDQYLQDARQQANILWGQAQERGVSEKMLNLLSYSINQYI